MSLKREVVFTYNTLVTKNMQKPGTPASPRLAELVEHKDAVSPGQSVSEVYEYFQKLAHEFMAVIDQGKLIGVISRGQIGFLLGARYGYAVYGRKPIVEHMLKQHLCIQPDEPLLQ